MRGQQDEIRVGQLNMNGQRIVPVQLLDYCGRVGIEVLLLQEPPIVGGKIYGFEEDIRVIMENRKGKSQVAIAILNPDIEVISLRGEMDRYFALATIRKRSENPVTLISAYFKFNMPVRFFMDRLGKL